MSQLAVVVGGQYGSEGKGAIAGALCSAEWVGHGPVTGVRVAGPNAGHTAYDADGRAWPLRQIPVAAVTNPDASLVIAAGSEVDWRVLQDEVDALEAAGIKVRDRLWIDSEATLLEMRHIVAEEIEGLQRRIGSTSKGIGAARADRIMRKANRVGDSRRMCMEYQVGDTAGMLSERLAAGWGLVVVEGTQGYGLGLHAGFYPKCTSSDCTAVDFLAMARISPWQRGISRMQVWVCLRSYPIRVAGDSGPMQGETSWEALGLPPEFTTVTKKRRRVGTWDTNLARAAVEANGGPPTVEVAWTMADQRFPEIRGEEGLRPVEDLPDAVREAVRGIAAETGAKTTIIGTGPRTQIAVGW